MVEVVTRARRFAKGAARGTGKTGSTFFGGRGGSRARSGRRAVASGEPAGRTYLRDGLLVLGGVAAGLLLGRRVKRGGAPPSPSSDAGGTGADASDRTTPGPAVVPGAPSGPPAQGPADGPGAGTPARRLPAQQDPVPPAPPSFAEPPRPEDPAGRSDEDFDRAPVEDVPSGRSSGTPFGEGSATAEEPPAAQEAEPPAEEAPSIIEELPPPPQASDVELSSPPSTPDVAEETPPPPPAEEAPSIVDELPPPPEVEEAELPTPPAPENILDELPPPPAPEEQSVGGGPQAPPAQEPADEPAVEAPRTEGSRVRRVTATAAAQRRAEELGVDLLEVEGTGPDGRITVDDVRRSGEQTRS